MITVANSGTTGTTVGKLAKLTGAPSTAVIAATTDTDGLSGVVTGWASTDGTQPTATTGLAIIVRAGIAACTFDGATTSNHYVQNSPTVNGDCHDTGSTTRPTSGQILGRVLTTNGGGGTYQMTVAVEAVGVNASGCSTSGSNTQPLTDNGSGGCSSDANATLVAGALGLGASGTVGSVTMGNGTSGTGKIHYPATGAMGTSDTTVPIGTSTMMALDLPDQTITGGAEVTTQSQSAGNITVDCTTRPMQYLPNTGAFTLTAPAKDSSCFFDMENGASAGAVTLSGFAPNTMGGDALDTTNGHNFRLFVSRNHGHSTIFARALQ